jgi:hypothetical protein
MEASRIFLGEEVLAGVGVGVGVVGELENWLTNLLSKGLRIFLRIALEL